MRDITPAMPYCREAYRLTNEGAPKEMIDREMEKAYQVDPKPAAYYAGRIKIMEDNKLDRKEREPRKRLTSLF